WPTDAIPPTTTYADYAPYIERLAAGEQNVLSGEPVIYFSTTSGTTGPPKMIPVTRKHMRVAISNRFTSMGMALRAGALNTMQGPFMTIMTEHLSQPTAGGVPTGAATTGGFKQLGHFGDFILAAPADVTRVHDQASARYLHLLFGLREELLWTIVAFFPATILFALRDLHEHAEQLLRDLADGTISRHLELPGRTRAELTRSLRPARERARGLGKLLEHDRFTVRDIWPQLGAILTATGGAFRFYADQLQPYLGKTRIFSPVYSSSEGDIGFGFSADRPHYLLPTMPYIEFLPVEEMDDPDARPIPAWQAEPGRKYEVVITTLDGFMRYRLTDILRVVEFHGQTPVIEFIERRGQLIDVVGEKTAEHHIVEAIDTASHVVEEPLVDYVVVPDTERTPACYLLALEEWHRDCEDNLKVRAFLRAVDAALRKVAPDYDEERELGTLGPMAVALLKEGAFERQRAQRVEAGGSASQIKTPHVIPDPGFFRRAFEHEIVTRVEHDGAD
ncbi:MAG: GH3 auxin-responsive promoter family protein, partial [Gammaproteobacteria bacterium]